MKNKIINTNIYIGPMSFNIINNIIKVANDEQKNIGLIASRRQIEYNSGYVMKTNDFVNLQKKSDNILICRDHGGIYQGEKKDNGILSFYNDKNFNIIHIDPWKKYKNIDEAIQETIDNIKFLNILNPNCYYEIGTEEAIRPYSVDEFEYLLYNLKTNLGELYNKIIYAVIQSGTKIIGLSNVGVFNEKKCKKMINICNKYDVLSKEHNGDYLSDDLIIKRFKLGLNAINIAPEFGVYETSIIYDNMNDNQKELFFNLCLESNKWKKWFPDNYDPYLNKKELIITTGHYLYQNETFKKLKNEIKNIDNKINKKLYNKIKNKINLWK